MDFSTPSELAAFLHIEKTHRTGWVSKGFWGVRGQYLRRGRLSPASQSEYRIAGAKKFWKTGANFKRTLRRCPFDKCRGESDKKLLCGEWKVLKFVRSALIQFALEFIVFSRRRVSREFKSHKSSSTSKKFFEHSPKGAQSRGKVLQTRARSIRR